MEATPVNKKKNVLSNLVFILGENDQANQCFKRYSDAAPNCKPINFLRCGGDELFVGRAGYLCGILWLRKILGRDIISQKDIFEICSSIIQSGRQYSHSRRSPAPLMYAYYDTEYLGKYDTPLLITVQNIVLSLLFNLQI